MKLKSIFWWIVQVILKYDCISVDWWNGTKKTNIRFRNFDDFETYINAINAVYDSEDVIFTGWVYRLNTPQFNKVNRSQYGKGADFKRDISEYTGNNCYIPTSGNCFIKSIICLTGRDCTEVFLNFIPMKKEEIT